MCKYKITYKITIHYTFIKHIIYSLWIDINRISTLYIYEMSCYGGLICYRGYHQLKNQFIVKQIILFVLFTNFTLVYTSDFQWGYSIFSFICMICRSLFVLLYFFFWPLCCLFFFDIRILITPLVSSIVVYQIYLILVILYVVLKLMLSPLRHK